MAKCKTVLTRLSYLIIHYLDNNGITQFEGVSKKSKHYQKQGEIFAIKINAVQKRKDGKPSKSEKDLSCTSQKVPAAFAGGQLGLPHANYRGQESTVC